MSIKQRILIVEDEFIVANDLRIILTKAGYEVCGIAVSVQQAEKLIITHKPDWVLLDIMLKGELTGIDLAQKLLTLNLPFLYISANTNEKTLQAAKATQPYGFLVKPFRERDLLVMLDIARYRFELAHAQPLARVLASSPLASEIIGRSAALSAAWTKIEAVAPASTSVLLLGESGTGKERVARAIHELSTRADHPLVTVNCAALPLNLLESELFGHEKGAFTGATQRRTGKFELADKGTIFLDEIGELPLDAQVKLLRVLQEREIERVGSATTVHIDVRIIAATNRNLEKEVAEGRFRLDLYYRLNVFPVELPPLRERKEDIESLANHFLQKFAKDMQRPAPGISAAALLSLQQYEWPGNIRQLEHVIERQLILTTGNEITHFDIPDNLKTTATPVDSFTSLEEMERAHILKALQISGGKVSGSGGAADLLSIPAQTLYSKMKKLRIAAGYK